MREWIVSAEESGARLMSFLKVKVGDGVSARQLKRAIDSGECQLNGKAERFASTIVGAGDRIKLHTLESKSGLKPLDDSRLRFLYIDADLAIVDKPAGVLSTDIGLLSAVRKKLPNAELIHRLDRETTGALIFAKAPDVSHAMASLFKKRMVQKTYFALVDGIPLQRSGVVENYLGKLSEYHGQTIWGAVAKEKGLPACTAWEVKKSGNEAALLACYPKTGRTHQIRIHLSGLGHPILGDYQYGRGFRCSYRPGRVLLHASAVVFEHPVTKQIIDVEAPLPQDFKNAIENLIGSK